MTRHFLALSNLSIVGSYFVCGFCLSVMFYAISVFSLPVVRTAVSGQNANLLLLALGLLLLLLTLVTALRSPSKKYVRETVFDGLLALSFLAIFVVFFAFLGVISSTILIPFQ